MATTRTPLNRPTKLRITPAAIATFAAMQEVECTCAPRDQHRGCAGCKEWWRLHAILHRELRMPLWRWPCVEDPEACSPYPPGCRADQLWAPDREAQALHRELEAAAEADAPARRRRARAIQKLARVKTAGA